MRRVFGDGPLPPLASLGASAAAAAQCEGCGPAMRPDYFFRLVFPDAGAPRPVVAGDTVVGSSLDLTDSLLQVEGAALSGAARLRAARARPDG